jgi:hypothetical protein
MAKKNQPQVTGKIEDIIRITDAQGNVVLEIGTREYSVTHSNGSLTQRKITETIPLVCGTIWNPKARFPIAVCELCRQPSFFKRKSHGLVALSRAKICVTCGQLCCPKHRKLGHDQRWRCLRHHDSYKLKNLFRPIFYEREE